MKKRTVMAFAAALATFAGAVVAQVVVQSKAPASIPINQKIDVAPVKLVDHDALNVLVKKNEFEGSVAYLSINVPGPNYQVVPFYLINRYKGVVYLHKINPNGADVVFDPQLSPDGKFTLVKSGWPYDYYGTYQFLVINNETGEVIEGDKGIRNTLIKWSPDSSKLLYIVGGYAGGQDDSLGKIQIMVFDLMNRQKSLVYSGVEGLCSSWRHDGDVIYIGKINNPKKDGFSYGLYSYDSDKSKKVIITPDAYFPKSADSRMQLFTPEESPDGRRLIYVRLAESEDHKSIDPFPRLCVYNINSKQVSQINSFRLTDKISYYWSDQSDKVVVLSDEYKRTSDGRGEGTAHLNIVDATSMKQISSSSLKLSDTVFAPRGRANRQFKVVALPIDKGFIYLQTENVTGHKAGQSLLDVSYSIYRLSVNDDKYREILNVKNIQGGSPGLSWLIPTKSGL